MGVIFLFVIFLLIFTVLHSLEKKADSPPDTYNLVSMEAVPLEQKKFCEPKNETEFREIFEKLASELYGYKISVSQIRCPNLLLYERATKKTVKTELEYNASDFFKHKHKWDVVDLIICWHNDIKKSDIPILECKGKITEYYKNMAGVN